MNLLNLIENTTGGYDNLRSLLQAVNTRSPAELNIAGDPITLDYMEANFLNGIYKAYLRAGRQEEFIQDLADPRRFDMHMKKLRDLIQKQKNFRGSVPGERGVAGDVPAGVMEGLAALEEISMQDPNNPTEQNSGKLNWTRMIQDYMGNKPFTEFEFGKSDRPLTIYRTQIYAILKAFGNMKPQQKVNIILNTFGNKLATVEYLDRLRAKKMIPQKVPAYVAPDAEPVSPGQMDLPGMETPKIREAAQKKSPQELARDTATSAKVQRAFQLARARQPAASSDIEAFVRDEIERGEELAQQVNQLQQDNAEQSQQIAQLTKAVARAPEAPAQPTKPATEPAQKPQQPQAEPRAKDTDREEPKAKDKDREEPKAKEKPKAEPQTVPVPDKIRKPPRRRPPKPQPQQIPVDIPPLDTIPTLPPQQIPQQPTAQILRFPGGKKDEVGAALAGVDLGGFPQAVGQNESIRVGIKGNALFEGHQGTVSHRIRDDFFMVEVDGFGSHAFHVSKLIFEMQTKIDRFNINRPMLPSGVAKLKYAYDNNIYDDARIQEALPDKAMAALQQFQQQQQAPASKIDLNVPADAESKMDFAAIQKKIAQLDELIRMKEQIDKLFLKAQNVRGGIYPGLQADIEMEELYPTPETDQEFQDLRDKYTKDLAALQKFLAMKKSVYREDQDLIGESTALVRLKQARQALSKSTVEESLRPGEYHVATVTLDNGDVKKFKVTSDEGYTDVIKKFYARQGLTVKNIDMDWSVQGDFYEDEKDKSGSPMYRREEVYMIVHNGKEVAFYKPANMKQAYQDAEELVNKFGGEAHVRKVMREAGVAETVTDVKAGMAEIYHRLAPKIERYRDSFLAGQLYDELENYAELHGAEREFKRMMSTARNSAHMEYDTNPGGFENWFWFLPFEKQLDEKQDACYHKVKSRYKVWPSAYASGALVQCRKKGADNWGNKKK